MSERIRRYEETLERRFRKSVRGAMDRGLEWTITWEEFEALAQRPCHYCESASPRTGSGLDRVDNRRGYTLDNVLPCCGRCNFIRGKELSVDEMLVVGAVLRGFARRGLAA